MAVPKFVQGVSAGANAASKATAAINTTQGNLMVITACVDAGTIAIVDSKSNIWTPVAAQINNASNTISARMYYCANAIGGGGHTFTVSGATNSCNITMQEFSGITVTSPLDVTTGTTGVGTALSSGATSALATSAELIVGGGGTDGTTLTLALGTGFTNLTSSSVATWLIGGQESKLATTVTGETGAMTGATGNNWCMIVATFINSVPSFRPNSLRPHPFSPGLAR